jgi:pyrroloquinoline quinone biosynthesis protein E
MQTDRFTAQPILIYPEAIVELKGPGPAIVALCDGIRPFAEILSALATQYKVAPQLLRADVTKYLQRLLEKRLIEIHPTPDAAPPSTFIAAPSFATSSLITQPSAPRPATPAALSRPMGLIAEVTYTCPLHCPYCSNPTHYPAGAELTTDEWRRVMVEAADAGVLHALFSGGEPLTRKDLEPIITAARQAGLYTDLITSAVGFTPQRAASLRAAGLDSIQISFQSDESPLGNIIAGANVHDRKLEAARLAIQTGFPLTINVVLHRHNIDHLDRIITLAHQLGARRLELANTQFYGWAFKNRDTLLPTRAQVERAQQVAAAARDRLLGAVDILYVLPDYFSDHPKPCMNGWAKRYISINPIGEALPCPTAAEIPGLHFDNIRQHSVGWIWEHSAAFNRFRGTAWMPEPCQSCDRRDIDFGGCRCQAAILTGDASNTDPVCVLAPRHQLVTDALSENAAENRRSLQSLVFRQGPNGS